MKRTLKAAVVPLFVLFLPVIIVMCLVTLPFARAIDRRHLRNLPPEQRFWLWWAQNHRSAEPVWPDNGSAGYNLLRSAYIDACRMDMNRH